MIGRINFEGLYNKYAQLGKPNVRLTQSSLFLTKPISSTQTTYTFDVLETQTATLQRDELRVNINDEFYITHLGLYLVATVTNGSYSGVKLLTYAPIEAGAQTLQVEGLFNGSLSIGVNNVIYLDKFDTRKFEMVPQTQFSSFFSEAGAYNKCTIAQENLSLNNMFPIEPMLQLSGAKKNTITLSLANAITGTNFTVINNEGDTLTYTIDRIGLVARGLNAQNGSVFQA